MPITSTSSGGSSSFRTSSESAIWGTAAGETKDTASMCLNPALIKARKYSSLICAGICPRSPCHASRGHSTSLTDSGISKSSRGFTRTFTDDSSGRFLEGPIRADSRNPCLRLQHAHLELRYVRVQRGRFQSLRDRIACFDRIDDFVDPQPGRTVSRIGLFVVGALG